MSSTHTPSQAEGDTNQSIHRQTWASHLDGQTRDLLDRDARAFLHQSVSTPCLSAVRKAEGIWIEDLQGRRYMDFHGNNVHHLGYGHPKLIAALIEQLQTLSFAPRRFTCEPAVELAEKLAQIAPGTLGKVLFAPSCLWGIELVEDRELRTPANEKAEAILYKCLEGGLSFKVTMGNVLTLTPPLIVTEEQINDALDILESAIKEV